MDKIANYIEEFKTRMRKTSWTSSDYDQSNTSATETGFVDFKMLRRFSSGAMNSESMEEKIIIP
jgi:hypothetical protein